MLEPWARPIHTYRPRAIHTYRPRPSPSRNDACNLRVCKHNSPGMSNNSKDRASGESSCTAAGEATSRIRTILRYLILYFQTHTGTYIFGVLNSAVCSPIH